MGNFFSGIGAETRRRKKKGSRGLVSRSTRPTPEETALTISRERTAAAAKESAAKRAEAARSQESGQRFAAGAQAKAEAAKTGRTYVAAGRPPPATGPPSRKPTRAFTPWTQTPEGAEVLRGQLESRKRYAEREAERTAKLATPEGRKIQEERQRWLREAVAATRYDIAEAGGEREAEGRRAEAGTATTLRGLFEKQEAVPGHERIEGIGAYRDLARPAPTAPRPVATPAAPAPVAPVPAESVVSIPQQVQDVVMRLIGQGWSADEVAAELTRRGIPVPQYLTLGGYLTARPAPPAVATPEPPVGILPGPTEGIPMPATTGQGTAGTMYRTGFRPTGSPPAPPEAAPPAGASRPPEVAERPRPEWPTWTPRTLLPEYVRAPETARPVAPPAGAGAVLPPTYQDVTARRGVEAQAAGVRATTAATIAATRQLPTAGIVPTATVNTDVENAVNLPRVVSERDPLGGMTRPWETVRDTRASIRQMLARAQSSAEPQAAPANIAKAVQGSGFYTSIIDLKRRLEAALADQLTPGWQERHNLALGGTTPWDPYPVEQAQWTLGEINGILGMLAAATQAPAQPTATP